MFCFCVTPIVPSSHEFAACFERARLSVRLSDGRQGLKFEELAALCGITRPRLTQCVTGGDFSMRKLWALMQDEDGRRFVEALFCEISLVKGLREWDGVIRALLVATDAITTGLRVAKAHISNQQDERRSA